MKQEKMALVNFRTNEGGLHTSLVAENEIDNFIAAHKGQGFVENIIYEPNLSPDRIPIPRSSINYDNPGISYIEFRNPEVVDKDDLTFPVPHPVLIPKDIPKEEETPNFAPNFFKVNIEKVYLNVFTDPKSVDRFFEVLNNGK